LLQLTKVERISQKLHIMSFIGNFFDTFHHLQPVRIVFCFFFVIWSTLDRLYYSLAHVFGHPFLFSISQEQLLYRVKLTLI